ncbi:MAG TPA: serine hydrolase domain-containing protein, partial [Caulobacteraceae bacterium]|nr:serine hydrolase domain-containing protein [Caulobacteraceae bacterium]
LAGYIVERVSGEEFDSYVAHHIFQPLGMTHSTFEQPLPANLLPDMAKGYPQASKPAKPFEYVVAAPAGSLSSTGDDMGKFMMAHLANGTYNGGTILKPETAILMHKEQYVLAPPLPGMALGFYHEDRNGQVIIAHAGDTTVFHSDLHLFLNDNVGLFMSFNSAGKAGAVGAVRSQLFRDFTDRYFPAPATAPLPTWKDAKADGATMAGPYIMNRRADTSFFRALNVLGRVTVTSDKDGILQVSAFKSPGGVMRKWREVGHFYWQEVNGSSRMAARFVDGKMIGFTSDDEPPVLLFSPAPAWSNPWPLRLSCLYILLFTLLWPISMWARARYGARFQLEGSAAKANRLVHFAALWDVAVMAMWAVFLTMITSSGELTKAIDFPLLTIQLLGFLSIVSALIGVWNLVVVWRDGGRSWFAKITSVLIALALITFVYVQFTLHLVGTQTNF